MRSNRLDRMFSCIALCTVVFLALSLLAAGSAVGRLDPPVLWLPDGGGDEHPLLSPIPGDTHDDGLRERGSAEPRILDDKGDEATELLSNPRGRPWSDRVRLWLAIWLSR